LKKNILFAVVGKTPAVLTETLYALSIKESVPIHEIEVITTQSGKAILRKNGFFDRKANPIIQLFKDYKLDKKYGVPVFNETRVRVPSGLKDNDINSDRNNHLMEAEITRRMRFLTSSEQNYTVYASLSGGRKTMSAYMNLAMTIFARPQDDLFHVLHEGPGGTAPVGWWYPLPKIKVQAKWINLFKVPFLRLRKHLEEFVPEVLIKDMPLTEASEMIEKAEFKQPKLAINLASKKEFILVNGKPLKAEPKSLWWLALLAWRKKHLKQYEVTTDIQRNYQFSDEEKAYLTKAYKTFKFGEDPETDFYEEIMTTKYWAPAGTKLNKELEKQLGSNAHFLNCQGGGRSVGAAPICQFIKLDRENINIQQ
jgi:CRISPR-associated protein (TIGR02584 family)